MSSKMERFSLCGQANAQSFSPYHIELKKDFICQVYLYVGVGKEKALEGDAYRGELVLGIPGYLVSHHELKTHSYPTLGSEFKG